jgi:hypothetical protein
VLLAGDRSRRVRFVIDNPTGRLVIPVEGFELEFEELLLFAPEERDDAMQIMGRPVRLEAAREGACDRWAAYHGKATERHWAALAIEGARMGEYVIDEVELVAINPLGPAEGRLCRRLNLDRAALERACRRVARVSVAEPIAVGVDPHGVDVRARFGIVRLEFEAPATDEPGAMGAIDALLAGPDNPGP